MCPKPEDLTDSFFMKGCAQFAISVVQDMTGDCVGLGEPRVQEMVDVCDVELPTVSKGCDHAVIGCSAG